MSRQPDETALAIPLTEEVATLAKHEVVTGRVTVRTTTELRHETLREELAEESVEVVRVPVGRVIDSLPEPRIEGDVTIVPVLEERLVVTKQLVLVEEIHIRRRRSVETVELPVTLRRQTAEVVELDLTSE